MSTLHVEELGKGPRVLLVHGSGSGGSAAWSAQLPLAERFRLVIPTRSGYPPNPPLERIDFEHQAEELAPLLEDGAHLVGHSYGGVISLFIAARHPEAVRSLAVSEPPAFALARGNRKVDTFVAAPERLWAADLEPEPFLREFFERSAAPSSRRAPPGRPRGGDARDSGRARPLGSGTAAGRARYHDLPQARDLGRAPSGVRCRLRHAREPAWSRARGAAWRGPRYPPRSGLQRASGPVSRRLACAERAPVDCGPLARRARAPRGHRRGTRSNAAAKRSATRPAITQRRPRVFTPSGAL